MGKHHFAFRPYARRGVGRSSFEHALCVAKSTHYLRRRGPEIGDKRASAYVRPDDRIDLPPGSHADDSYGDDGLVRDAVCRCARYLGYRDRSMR